MARSQQELAHILSYGAGLDISAEGYTQEDLLQIATNIGAGKGMLILRDTASRPTGDLVNITASAAGRVIFVDP
jgi:hypothetical protein